MLELLYRPNLNTASSTQREHQEETEVLELQDSERLLFVHNDDYNTFDWVIKCLVDICGHDAVQAEQCAYIIHFQGKCQVSHGPEELISERHLALIQRGLTATIH
jgi:ATP-dependent Clp protease adaptor protein ClpS